MALRLNVGAGDDRREGYVSVDLRPDVADVVAPADRLPYADESVDELLALDVLEHFWRDDVPAVLAEWRRVLRPGGTLTVRVPNLVQLGRQLARGYEVDTTIRNIYGGHRWGPGGSFDTHHWGWTPITLARDLDAAGFRVHTHDRRANMTVTCERRP